MATFITIADSSGNIRTINIDHIIDIYSNEYGCTITLTARIEIVAENSAAEIVEMIKMAQQP